MRLQRPDDVRRCTLGARRRPICKGLVQASQARNEEMPHIRVVFPAAAAKTSITDEIKLQENSRETHASLFPKERSSSLVQRAETPQSL